MSAGSLGLILFFIPRVTFRVWGNKSSLLCSLIKEIMIYKYGLLSVFIKKIMGFDDFYAPFFGICCAAATIFGRID